MEAKEHIFLAGPYLTTAFAAFLYTFRDEFVKNNWSRMLAVISALLIFIGVALVSTMGIFVTGGYRVGLEG